MMNDDPMSVFSRAVSKSRTSKGSEPAQAKLSELAPSGLSEGCVTERAVDRLGATGEVALPKEQAPRLPADWREKIAEMRGFLQKARRVGSQVPMRYGMSEYEFEAFMNNPDNFQPEEWALICQARQQVQSFVGKMQQLLGAEQGQHQAKPKRKIASRGWINVD